MILHEVKVHVVDTNQLKEFWDKFSGITVKNILLVQAKLAELGLSLAVVAN